MNILLKIYLLKLNGKRSRKIPLQTDVHFIQRQFKYMRVNFFSENITIINIAFYTAPTTCNTFFLAFRCSKLTTGNNFKYCLCSYFKDIATTTTLSVGQARAQDFIMG